MSSLFYLAVLNFNNPILSLHASRFSDEEILQYTDRMSNLSLYYILLGRKRKSRLYIVEQIKAPRIARFLITVVGKEHYSPWVEELLTDLSTEFKNEMLEIMTRYYTQTNFNVDNSLTEEKRLFDIIEFYSEKIKK